MRNRIFEERFRVSTAPNCDVRSLPLRVRVRLRSNRNAPGAFKRPPTAPNHRAVTAPASIHEIFAKQHRPNTAAGPGRDGANVPPPPMHSASSASASASALSAPASVPSGYQRSAVQKGSGLGAVDPADDPDVDDDQTDMQIWHSSYSDQNDDEVTVVF